MFEAKRLYCQTDFRTGAQNWYFSSREGAVGPFSTKQKAANALDEFIKFNDESANHSGRNFAHIEDKINKLTGIGDNGSHLALVPIEGWIH